MKNQIAVLVLLVTSTFSIRAQSAWTLDQGHSEIKFNVSHLVVSSISGRFHTFNATLTGQPSDFKNGSLQAMVEVKSIDTGVADRDEHLKGSDFFESTKYPLITFQSVRIEKQPNQHFNIVGDLTMKGITKRIILDALYKGSVNAFGKERLVFSCIGKINRFDYDLTYSQKMDSGGLVVGEEIEFNINAELVRN